MNRWLAWILAVTVVSGCSSAADVSAPPGSQASYAPLRVASSNSLSRTRDRPPPPTLSPHTFAYSTIGSSVVAVASRVRRAARSQGPITVVRFDPTHTRLVLHAGSADPAPTGHWHHGPRIQAPELTRLVAAFNGGFKMPDSRGGWRSEGRTVVPLVRGAASVVTYADGGADIGAWGREVPTPGRRVVSVRQNLQLLIDNGRARRIHPPDQAVLDEWWGHAFLAAPLISRSALGVTAGGALVWAAGTDITVAALAHALLGAGVARAIELDINAPLVRGFLYAGAAIIHRGSRVTHSTVPLVVGQRQLRHDPGLTDPSIAPHCTYVLPCSRDFFTVLTR